jgi:uncharacterized glyoxalase superfamily protein PhnB
MKRPTRKSGRVTGRTPLTEQLDKAIEKIMSDRESKPPRVNSRITGIVRIASELRDLPREEFRVKLKRDLVSSAAEASAPGNRLAHASGAPEGYRSITPYLQVKDAQGLIEFLKNAFDAEELLRVPRGAQIGHAQLRIENSMIETADAIGKYQPAPTAIWLFAKDCDSVYARALKAGAASIHEPRDQDYGDREASVKDPFGNHWYIATHRADAEPLPEEMRNITPYLHPKGTAQVIDFLKRAFGAEEIFRAQNSAGIVQHAQIRIGDSIIAMGEAHGPYQPMPPALHLYVPDADATYKRALEAGAASIDEPAEQDYGDRYAGVKDPFGNVWYIATHLRDFSTPAKTTTARAAQPEASEVEPHRRPGSIMPFMYLDDVVNAFDLYHKVFAATEQHRVTQPDATVSHIVMAIGETHVMLRNATTPDLAQYRARGFADTPHRLGGSPVHLYIYVEDADGAFKRALDSGCVIVDPIGDKEWGDRCGGVQDPFGHIWYIATPLQNASH